MGASGVAVTESPALAVLACPGAKDLRGGQRPRGVLHGSAHPEAP